MKKIATKKIESQIVHLSVPITLLSEVDRFQEENGYTTRTAATLELIRKGLKNKD